MICLTRHCSLYLLYFFARNVTYLELFVLLSRAQVSMAVLLHLFISHMIIA
jgi:hypothetical protein